MTTDPVTTDPVSPDPVSPDPSVAESLASESAAGLTTAGYYAGFGERVSGIQRDLVSLLRELREQGRTIAAYGAAAKGATLLNSSGIDADLIDFVVDRNVHKQGMWLPGATLPILPAEALLERRPDYVLVLAWNFADEIRRQQSAYEQAGGRFILPVPEPRVLA